MTKRELESKLKILNDSLILCQKRMASISSNARNDIKEFIITNIHVNDLDIEFSNKFIILKVGQFKIKITFTLSHLIKNNQTYNLKWDSGTTNQFNANKAIDYFNLLSLINNDLAKQTDSKLIKIINTYSPALSDERTELHVIHKEIIMTEPYKTSTIK